MWAGVLLAMIIYIFTVFLMQAITDELIKSGQSMESFSDLFPFNSLFRTMYTLFKAICGGITWGDAVEPLLSFNLPSVVLVAMYVAFALFCVLNIVTAIFVENARTMAET